MDINTKATKILELLKQEYSDTTPPLIHRNAFELLIATILSAQTTDLAVNQVSPLLFAEYPDAQGLAAADIEKVKVILRPIGLYNTKSQRVIATSQMLLNDFDGQIPQTVDELIKLPGVGRKVATVVLWQAFGVNEGFTVDTHVLRLSKWLGLSEYSKPEKVERDLMKLFPQSEWGDTSLRLIFLGRDKLTARNPQYEGTVWEQFVEIK